MNDVKYSKGLTVTVSRVHSFAFLLRSGFDRHDVKIFVNLFVTFEFIIDKFNFEAKCLN